VPFPTFILTAFSSFDSCKIKIRFHYQQGFVVDRATKIFGKNCPIFGKVAKEAKNAKNIKAKFESP
jgi:hypothetical protein